MHLFSWLWAKYIIFSQAQAKKREPLFFLSFVPSLYFCDKIDMSDRKQLVIGQSGSQTKPCFSGQYI